MKVLALVVLAIVAFPLFGQFNGHRATPYGSMDAALAAATGDISTVTQAKYTTTFGTFESYLLVEQPLFQDACDLTGAASPVPPQVMVSGACTFTKTGGGAVGPYNIFADAKAFVTNTLTAFQRADSSIVLMTGKYWVVFPFITAECVGSSCGFSCPSVTQQPQNANITACSGSAVLTFTLNCTASAYQWYQGISGDISHPIIGATSSSLTVHPCVTTQYWCQATAPACMVNSSTATVFVH
jgi:hypothetical protein